MSDAPHDDGGWTRRSFVRTLLASGFAAAVQPVCAQTILTDEKGLVTEAFELPTGDRPIPAYCAMPASDCAWRLSLPVSTASKRRPRWRKYSPRRTHWRTPSALNWS